MDKGIRDLAVKARAAAGRLAAWPADGRDQALQAMAGALHEAKDEIFAANQQDLARAREEGLAGPLLKRLVFDEGKLQSVMAGLRDLVKLPDPIGRVLEARELDRGLELRRLSCPIGVVGVIFESRPDALVQISGLCLKSANAVLLKGGREALATNRALVSALNRGTAAAGVPEGWMQLLETREDVSEMLALDRLIDLIIPRGSNDFVRHIMTCSRIPVMGHADGVCHLYIDREADPAMAEAIAIDAKCQYTAVCNALETLLVDQAVAGELLPRLAAALTAKGVKLRGCPRTVSLTGCAPAEEKDWRTEYLDSVLAVRVVAGLGEAVDHINCYGSHHTDSIVTGNPATAGAFMSRVDSGNVFWNASTRFSDGYRYGLGAEVGICTGKLHARGPVGLTGLTTYKWLLTGQGHTVAPYAEGARSFTHVEINPEGNR